MNYHGKNSWVYVDGEFMPSEQVKLDLFSQSLHYGFAATDGVRAFSTHNDTRLFMADQHFERLKYSSECIGLPFSWEIDHLIDKTYELLKCSNLRSAYVRPMVVAGQNMFLTPAETSSIVIMAWEWGPFLGNSTVRLGISAIERQSPQSVPPDIKITGQYPASILATQRAIADGYDEALLLDAAGYVSQSSSNNIFIEKDGVLLTPQKGSLFPGITREVVFHIASRLGIQVVEKQLTTAEVLAADSAFLTGTATGIVGIAAIDKTIYPEEWPNTLGAAIQRAYKSLTLEKENYEVII